MNPHDDLEAYVLGALERTEARDFESHLAQCDPCRDGIASYGAVMRGLRSIPHVAPPAMPLARTGFDWRRAVAAALLVGVGLGGGFALNRPNGEALAIVAMVADHPREIRLDGPAASGQVIVGARHQRTAFVVRGLPEPPSGSGYQVWVKGAGISSPGMLHRMRSGLEVLIVEGDVIEGARHIGITLEPAGGSPKRTGATQVQGDVIS